MSLKSWISEAETYTFTLENIDLIKKRKDVVVQTVALRQGAGGPEFARFGSRTCFLRWFYERSQIYFGQKPEEHGFSVKKRCLEVKTMIFEKNVLCKK